MNIIEKMLYDRTILIANSIALNDYEMLAKKGCLDKISKEDIKLALSEYGGSISFISKDQYNGRFDCYKCPNDIYKTEIDLLIDEEISDLTLICEFVVKNDEIVAEVITDIHVL